MTIRRRAVSGRARLRRLAWAVLGLLGLPEIRGFGLGSEGSYSLADRWTSRRRKARGMNRRKGEMASPFTREPDFHECFYLAYHLYRDYFPLLALTTYRKAMERESIAA